MAETIYICPKCYGKLKMPERMPGTAYCDDCEGAVFVMVAGGETCWIEPLHTIDWEPPVENFSEAVLTSTMTDGQKLYWLVDAWRKDKAEVTCLRELSNGQGEQLARLHRELHDETARADNLSALLAEMEKSDG